MPNRTEAAKRKPSHKPPGDYCYCASSRLYNYPSMTCMQPSHPEPPRGTSRIVANCTLVPYPFLTSGFPIGCFDHDLDAWGQRIHALEISRDGPKLFV